MGNGLFSKYEANQRRYKRIRNNPKLYEELKERQRKAKAKREKKLR